MRGSHHFKNKEETISREVVPYTNIRKSKPARERKPEEVTPNKGLSKEATKREN
jgi:hypothetical protein